MAIAGAGNPVSGGTSGVGSSLNYIGDHVYMNTGRVDFDGTETTVAETVSGSGYIVGKLSCMAEADGSDDIRIRLYFNDEQVMGDIATSPPAVHDSQFNPLYIIIHPILELRSLSIMREVPLLRPHYQY